MDVLKPTSLTKVAFFILDEIDDCVFKRFLRRVNGCLCRGGSWSLQGHVCVSLFGIIRFLFFPGKVFLSPVLGRSLHSWQLTLRGEKIFMIYNEIFLIADRCNDMFVTFKGGNALCIMKEPPSCGGILVTFVLFPGGWSWCGSLILMQLAL